MVDGGTNAEPPRGGTPRPIALYLFALAVVALVPAFVFSAYLLARNNETQARVLSSLTVATTQAIAGAVDRQLDGLGITLRVLESSDVLAEQSLAAFHTRASRALAGTGAYLLVLDGELNQLLNTRVPFGTELPRTSAIEVARAAVDTGEPAISGVFFGQVAQDWVFDVLRPIPPQPNGARLLILTQNAASLATALTTREFPPAWSVALVDSGGLVINASGTPLATVGDPFMLAIDASPGRQGTWQSLDVDGVPNTAVFANVGRTGWRVVAWAPESAVQQPLAEAFWSLLAGGILLSAVVVLIIYWVSLRIGRSVHGLEDDAELLGAGETVPARPYPITEIATVSQALAEASRRRKAAETDVRLLMRELAHRSKNQLTVIAAMAKQSAALAGSVPEFVASLERRIFSLARSTDLMLAHGPAGIELRQVFARQVDPLCPLDSGRVSLEGPPLTVSTQAAQILGMAAHELAANAARYGAFATAAGRVSISWSVAGDGLEVVWRETGATVKETQERRGFGTTVLGTMVSRSLGAQTSQTFHADGVEWRATIPLAALDVHTAAEAVAPEESGEK
jgi:two-component sensor histidine kinase